MAPPPRHERSEPRRNSAPHRLNAKNPLSLVPSCHDIFFLETLPTNICLPFRKRLRGLFDFLPATQIACTPLSPETRRKTSPNPPLKALFFARKSCRFYVPKMSLKNANGCSVCAWLLTSGGLRVTLRLTPQRHPLASLAGADQAHTLSRTNHRLTAQFLRAKEKEFPHVARRKARRGAEPSPLTRSGSAAALPRRLRFLSALSDSLPFHAFCFSVLCSSPLRILLFRPAMVA